LDRNLTGAARMRKITWRGLLNGMWLAPMMAVAVRELWPARPVLVILAALALPPWLWACGQKKAPQPKQALAAGVLTGVLAMLVFIAAATKTNFLLYVALMGFWDLLGFGCRLLGWDAWGWLRGRLAFTPPGLLVELRLQMDRLAGDGTLKGEGATLKAKLNQALLALDARQDAIAAGHLAEFHRGLQTLSREGQLAPEKAQPLIATAERAMAKLSSRP
jgi:hypothetical protein